LKIRDRDFLGGGGGRTETHAKKKKEGWERTQGRGRTDKVLPGRNAGSVTNCLTGLGGPEEETDNLKGAHERKKGGEGGVVMASRGDLLRGKRCWGTNRA